VRAIRRAERDGAVTRNVAALSDTPAAPGRVSKALTLEQVGALLALDLSPWWRAFITVGVMTGLRPGELLGLRWEDTDLDTGLLRVRQALKRGTDGKGRAGLTPGELKTAQSRRTLRMPAPARSALKVLAASRPLTGCAWGSTTPRPVWSSPTMLAGQCGRRRQRGNSRTCARRPASAATGSSES
jgi:integrase